MTNQPSVDDLPGLVNHYMETRRRPACVRVDRAMRAILTWASVSPPAAFERIIIEAARRHGHAVDIACGD